MMMPVSLSYYMIGLSKCAIYDKHLSLGAMKTCDFRRAAIYYRVADDIFVKFDTGQARLISRRARERVSH